MNTFIPEAEKAFPGMKVFLIGGGMEIGGSTEGKEKYSMIYYFESDEIFNKYFDAEGNPNDAFMEAIEKLGPTSERMDKLGTNSAPTLGWKVL
jgi:hypothetical protein